MSLVTPTKWQQLTEGRWCSVQWVHPEAAINPKHYDELIWRDGTVTERTKNGVMVRLYSGGSVEIRNMQALQVDQTPEEAAKNSKRKAGA